MSNGVLFKRFLFSSDTSRFPPVFRKPQALAPSVFLIGSTGRESSPLQHACQESRTVQLTFPAPFLSSERRSILLLWPVREFILTHYKRSAENKRTLREKLFARLLNWPLWALVPSWQQAALLLGSWFKSQMGFSGWKFITLRVEDWNIERVHSPWFNTVVNDD